MCINSWHFEWWIIENIWNFCLYFSKMKFDVIFEIIQKGVICLSFAIKYHKNCTSYLTFASRRYNIWWCLLLYNFKRQEAANSKNEIHIHIVMKEINSTRDIHLCYGVEVTYYTWIHLFMEWNKSSIKINYGYICSNLLITLPNL